MINPYLLLLILFPLPTGTDRRLRRAPWVTLALIFVTFAVFGLTRPDANPESAAKMFEQWGLYPGSGEPITLISYLFVHISLQHLFWNMLFLWLFGPPVEEAVGAFSFCLFYFGGGLAAGVLNMAFLRIWNVPASTITPLVGASGAISAILAPFAVRFYRSRIHTVWLPGLFFGRSWIWPQVPALVGVSAWLIQTIVGAIRTYDSQPSGGTAYLAHAGGFIFGLLSVEITGLLRSGQQEYLLEDARAAAARGHVLSSAARQCYQAFLRGDSENLAVRSEYAAVLVREVSAYGGVKNADYTLAVSECRKVVRTYLDRGRTAEGYRQYLAAEDNGIRLAPPPGERLHLARAAEECGDVDTARRLLRSVIRDCPDGAEDEIARLRLGQLLVSVAPAESAELLKRFLERYPQSQWKVLADQLRQSALAAAGQQQSASGNVNPV